MVLPHGKHLSYMGPCVGQAKRKRISLFDENAWFANGVEEIKTHLINDLPAIRRCGISSKAQGKGFIEGMALPR